MRMIAQPCPTSQSYQQVSMQMQLRFHPRIPEQNLSPQLTHQRRQQINLKSINRVQNKQLHTRSNMPTISSLSTALKAPKRSVNAQISSSASSTTLPKQSRREVIHCWHYKRSKLWPHTPPSSSNSNSSKKSNQPSTDRLMISDWAFFFWKTKEDMSEAEGGW